MRFDPVARRGLFRSRSGSLFQAGVACSCYIGQHRAGPERTGQLIGQKSGRHNCLMASLALASYDHPAHPANRGRFQSSMPGIAEFQVRQGRSPRPGHPQRPSLEIGRGLAQLFAGHRDVAFHVDLAQRALRRER